MWKSGKQTTPSPSLSQFLTDKTVMHLTGLNATLGMLGFSEENIEFSEVTVGFVDLQAVKTTHMVCRRKEKEGGERRRKAEAVFFCIVLRITRETVVSCCTMDDWKVHGRMETLG